MKTAKQQPAYAVKHDGIYKLHGKNYVIIKGKDEQKIAWDSLRKRLETESVWDEFDENRATVRQSYNPTPASKTTTLDTILVNAEFNNNQTISAMTRILKVLDKVCPVPEMKGSSDPRDTPINTIQKLQYENQTQVYINDRLGAIAGHMEDNL